MNGIDLGPDLDGFVSRQVESGRFRDANEVLRAGLRLLEQREVSHTERRTELLRQIATAADDMRPSLTCDTVFDAVERKHAARSEPTRRDA